MKSYDVTRQYCIAWEVCVARKKRVCPKRSEMRHGHENATSNNVPRYLMVNITSLCSHRGYLGPGGPLLGTNDSLVNCTGGAANYIDKTILTYNHTYQTCTARVSNEPHFHRLKCRPPNLSAFGGKFLLF